MPPWQRSSASQAGPVPQLQPLGPQPLARFGLQLTQAPPEVPVLLQVGKTEKVQTPFMQHPPGQLFALQLVQTPPSQAPLVPQA